MAIVFNLIVCVHVYRYQVHVYLLSTILIGIVVHGSDQSMAIHDAMGTWDATGRARYPWQSNGNAFVVVLSSSQYHSRHSSMEFHSLGVELFCQVPASVSTSYEPTSPGEFQ